MARAAALALPLILIMPAAGSAQDTEGWGTGYHLGTAYAGLTNAGGAHLGVYCAAAAEDNPGVRGGPYVQFSLPRRLDPAPAAGTVTFAVDDRSFPVPMIIDVGEASTTFDWAPGKAYTTDQMRTLVDALRRGKSLVVTLTDPETREPFSLAGSGSALDGILDCARR